MNLAGRTLGQGKYELLERIASTNTATVYKAHQVSVNRVVAIKVLHEHLTVSKFRERLDLEAQVMGRLEHNHIVKIIDYDSETIDFSEFFYLVMEFIKGDTLRTWLNRKEKVTLEEAFEFMNQLTDALIYIHGENVAHRDLKPENVMFKKPTQLVLTDFGLARLIESEGLTTIGTTLGTPHYMAPEVMMGEKDYNAFLVDVYGLGVMFYELLTSQTLYEGTTEEVWVKGIKNEPYDPPRKLNSAIPPHVEAIILKAIARKPEDRFQTMQSFQQALNEAQSDEPEKQSTATNHSTGRPWLKFIAVGLIVIAIAAAIVMGAMWAFGPPPPNGGGGGGGRDGGGGNNNNGQIVPPTQFELKADIDLMQVQPSRFTTHHLNQQV